LQTPRTAATDQPEALVNAAKFTTAEPPMKVLLLELDDPHNLLILKGYLFDCFSRRNLSGNQAQRPVRGTANRGKYLKLF
jgi:hypothetical protein